MLNFASTHIFHAMHNINLTVRQKWFNSISHAYYFPLRAFSFISFPTTASFVPSRIEAPPPSLSSPFPLHSSSLFSPSFFIRCPDKTFLTRDISRYEWGATGTIFRVAVTPLASSPWPAHAIYLSRLRDSNRLSFPPPLSSRRLPCRFVATSVVASFVRGKALPRSAFEVDVSSGHIFVANPRAARPESPSEAVQVNLRKYLSTVVRVDVSVPI